MVSLVSSSNADNFSQCMMWCETRALCRRLWEFELQQTCSLVLSAHIEDAVGVDLKGDLNLRHSARGWRDACEVKLAQLVVVLRHGTLSLIDLHRSMMLERICC